MQQQSTRLCLRPHRHHQPRLNHRLSRAISAEGAISNSRQGAIAIPSHLPSTPILPPCNNPDYTHPVTQPSSSRSTPPPKPRAEPQHPTPQPARPMAPPRRSDKAAPPPPPEPTCISSTSTPMGGGGSERSRARTAAHRRWRSGALTARPTARLVAGFL
ncbi:uncharacterized protein BO66DRAFT_45686 [Aspergillus aculeatinus CBS 121060]|uniref:Uncharacterized protein n=1 Tax=Aspergillus aculeatinus CBS 121060 TaxID=1448322 RepID=A0ACD1HDW9_9EURO|nr:hypothetical protein BO66DRAFT_45686 [Aspergillus aculeatinus CBS 121060]RAH71655.1 hypothetical protein BO66DRAFT_45686 [Aspergillus aculeatinus CBS 121060]